MSPSSWPAGLASALATIRPGGAGWSRHHDQRRYGGVLHHTQLRSATIIGTLSSHGSYAIPWVIQVASDPGQCVRLEMTKVLGSGLNLEMVVVSPSGVVYRDDDGGG